MVIWNDDLAHAKLCVLKVLQKFLTISGSYRKNHILINTACSRWLGNWPQIDQLTRRYLPKWKIILKSTSTIICRKFQQFNHSENDKHHLKQGRTFLFARVYLWVVLKFSHISLNYKDHLPRRSCHITHITNSKV